MATLSVLPGRSFTGSGKSMSKRRAERPPGAPQLSSMLRPSRVSTFCSASTNRCTLRGAEPRKMAASGPSSEYSCTRSSRLSEGGALHCSPILAPADALP